MDARYINAFIEAVDAVFPMVVQEKISRGQPFVKANPFSADSVAVIVGITGDVEGQAVFSFRNGYAKKVAGAMCGTETAELDDLALSALAELCNMISGRAATNLDEIAGKKAVIAPPAVMVGDSMKVYVKPPILCVPFAGGGFELNCAFG